MILKLKYEKTIDIIAVKFIIGSSLGHIKYTKQKQQIKKLKKETNMTKSTKIIAALGVAAGLGIAALPAGSIFAVEGDLVPFNYNTATSTGKDVTVRLTVGQALALAVESATCDAGSAQVKTVKFCSEKVAGGTNAANGFTLSVADKDTNTSLENQETGSTATIAATGDAVYTGTVESPVWAKAGWNLTGGALNHAAIASSADTALVVMKTNAPKDAQTVITYNIATAENQEIGTYEDQIQYTIAANGSAVQTEEGLTGATVISNGN